jgi:tetratricopeptide (TPR) repeat protein
MNDHCLNSCCRWRTLQQRVKPVSSSAARLCFVVLVLAYSRVGYAQSMLPAQSQTAAAKVPAPSTEASDPRALFRQGDAALKSGSLDAAERSFRGVLAIDPQAAGAYANLGVIYMRRRQWPHALEMLRKAEHLAPQIAGIRLNIGLVYYRQNDFRDAIPPFESVVRDVPDSFQARYLLGLCYFFVERYDDAATVLEPLWSQASGQLNYLYVLGIAANKAGRAELEKRALGHLVEIGQNSPEFHLLMGKAHLNREEYDDAILELDLAAKGDPSLPFVHFNLGIAYLKKQDLERAKAEFLKDVAIDPDVAYNYDQLGLISYLQQQDADSEKMLRKALHLDPQLASSRFQLARVYQRQNKYSEALAEIDAAIKLDPESEGTHYLRGQVLQHMGRAKEAKAEMQTFTEMSNTAREKRHKELDASPVPSPELTQEPQ